MNIVFFFAEFVMDIPTQICMLLKSERHMHITCKIWINLQMLVLPRFSGVRVD